MLLTLTPTGGKLPSVSMVFSPLSFISFLTLEHSQIFRIVVKDLEGVQEEDLKEKAKVGYRADRILRLAKSFRDEVVDPVWLEARDRTR